MDLVDAINGRMTSDATLAYGTVASVVLAWNATTGIAAVVNVNIGGSPIQLGCLAGYQPAVKDTVACLVQSSRGIVLGPTRYVPVAPPAPTPPPPPAPTLGTSTFPAADAATYRGGWRTDTGTLFQGDWTGRGLNTGTWFYGTAPAATLAGATVRSASVWLSRASGGVSGGQAVSLWLTTDASRGGAPNRIAGPTTVATLAVGQAGWFAVPTDWASQIIAGTARGLAIHSNAASPYIAIAGLAADGQSGALSIAWQR